MLEWVIGVGVVVLVLLQAASLSALVLLVRRGGRADLPSSSGVGKQGAPHIAVEQFIHSRPGRELLRRRMAERLTGASAPPPEGPTA